MLINVISVDSQIIFFSMNYTTDSRDRRTNNSKLEIRENIGI